MKYMEPEHYGHTMNKKIFRKKIDRVDIKWNVETGCCTYNDAPVVTMWLLSTYKGLMESMRQMVGKKRLHLALQKEGRESVEDDWRIIAQYETLDEGVRRHADLAALGGWGRNELVKIDYQKQAIIFRNYNSVEGRYQEDIGGCYGSGLMAGKFAGWGEKIFHVPCWARQTQYIAHGDVYDEFHVFPSSKTIEAELDGLLQTDEATRADMAVAIKRLNDEIGERKMAEEELRRLRNYLSNIINSMPSVLVGVDLNGKVTQWNKKAEETTGVTANAAQGYTLSEVFPRMAPEMEKISESIRTKKISHERKKLSHFKNETCYEDVTIYPLITNSGVEGAVIRIDDVTDKVRMEELMIQNEKMLSIGGLAAGMAHEINNPLAGMMQTASVMANRLSENRNIPANLKAAEEANISIEAIGDFMDARGIPRMINSISESGRRVADIVDNMLSFARKSESIKLSHKLDGLLDKTIELAATDYDLKKHYDFKTITIQKEYEDNLPAVPCERAKIQQVLLNLLRNGAQAMQESRTKKPRFIVRTRCEKSRKMLRIEIEDNGPGMDEDICKRVFEPFFTTKMEGVGSGLGLSLSYFIIVENHGGEMAVESSLGFGAKFIIRLPLEV